MVNVVQCLADNMRNHTFVLTIKRWDDGPGFDLAVQRHSKAPEYPIRLMPGFDTGQGRGSLNRPLRPVGFYVAYSYTLFRTGKCPHDPLYAFF